METDTSPVEAVPADVQAARDAADAMTEDARNVASLASLRDPLPEHLISKKPIDVNKGGEKRHCQVCGGYHAPSQHLDYAGHAAITERLLEVDPGWSWEPVTDPEKLAVLPRTGGTEMWIELTVCGVTRLGYGDAQGKSGPNAVKEVIGDALRNAAMRFGVGLDLWHKGDLHADQEAARQAEEQAARETVMLDQAQAIADAAGALPMGDSDTPQKLRDLGAQARDAGVLGVTVRAGDGVGALEGYLLHLVAEADQVHAPAGEPASEPETAAETAAESPQEVPAEG